MNVATVGGGPGGLYASLLLAKSMPDASISLFEKNPRGATYGWGVVFSDRTLASFREADPETYEQITDAFAIWDVIEVRYKEHTLRCGGQVFSGMSRKRLLEILQNRCTELGVSLHFETEVSPQDLADYDLVLAADGIHSAFRATHGETLRPRVTEGRSRYIWFGTTCPFDSFTFVFRPTTHGLFQAHVYPFDGSTSTFIVECDEKTWRTAGLEGAGEAESIAVCERVFAQDLAGHELMSNQSRWLTFPTLTTRRWWHRNVAFLGDAVHTAHFSIGSGTKLAMEDAIALAREITRHADLPAAFGAYELERKGVVERFQQAARESQEYFESTSRYMHLDPEQFVFHLLTRSGRVGYDDLRVKDSRLIDRVDAWFARARGHGGRAWAPPPAFAPLDLRGLHLENRIVAVPPPTDDGSGGLPDDALLDSVSGASGRGVGLVLVGDVAVSADGRTTPGSPGLYEDGHPAAWARLAPGESKLGLRLTHAGRRGATRPRARGLDRPLSSGAWPLLAPSPIAYGSNVVPREMTRHDMERVVAEFATAATLAVDAGVDLLGLELGRGHLLGSFLSPLANRRTDDFGGDNENRARFPIEVVRAVRESWAGPLLVSVSASDASAGGAGIGDALFVAGALAGAGCDLLEVSVGGAVPDAAVPYDPYTLPSYADRLRGESGLPVLVGGAISSIGRVNTLVASGRSDLCVLMPSRS